MAVVDDGFRLSHKTLKNYIYTNEKEVPGNFQDDDQNGYVDDVQGWDASDGDNDVALPKGREKGILPRNIYCRNYHHCFRTVL